MRITTRVFTLAREYGYTSDRLLADAIGVSGAQVARVRNGQRQINHNFIVGALRAFPGKTFDDLFFVVRDQIRQAEPAA